LIEIETATKTDPKAAPNAVVEIVLEVLVTSRTGNKSLFDDVFFPVLRLVSARNVASSWILVPPDGEPVTMSWMPSVRHPVVL
jgi:hypothetical protein